MFLIFKEAVGEMQSLGSCQDRRRGMNFHTAGGKAGENRGSLHTARVAG